MAHLKITTPERFRDSEHFTHGNMARTWLNGVEISRFTTKVVVSADAEDVLRAEIYIVLSSLELDMDGVSIELRRQVIE